MNGSCNPCTPKTCTELGWQCGYGQEPNCLTKVDCGTCTTGVCNETTHQCGAPQCKDGTIYNQCSTSKPQYCSNGTLINRCSYCGCPEGYNCNWDETCAKPSDCSETDKGDDPATGGQTTLLSIQKETDNCQQGSLKEFYCQNNSIQSQVYDCQVFCKTSQGANWQGKCESNTLQQGYCECTNIVPPAENKKNTGNYVEKEAFLVSDKDWRAALALVPAAIWTEKSGAIIKHPILIFHEEDTGFDADSVIYFLQQYTPNRATIIGTPPNGLTGLLTESAGNMTPGESLGAGLSASQIKNISPADYTKYWADYKDAVYVQADYELALLASAYASLINAPLLIEGFNDSIPLEGRNIVCVGSPNTSCSEKYSLAELQKKYLQMTNTDKIILLNPLDLGNFVEWGSDFTTSKSNHKIEKLYGKMSMAAPALAGAKHELILSTTSTGYADVDKFIEGKIKELGIKAEYLTIMAAPNAIEMGISYQGSFYLQSADSLVYAELNDGDWFLDLAVGRIFGITVSDASSNIARSLFYKETIKNPLKALSTRGMPTYNYENIVYSLGETLKGLGIDTKITACGTTAEDWKKRGMIFYFDHGAPNWAGINSSQIPWLDNSIVIAYACSTCKGNPSLSPDLFCANAIRKGAIVYSGTTDITYIGDVSLNNFTLALFNKNKPIGAVFKEYINGNFAGLNYMPKKTDQMVLIGDPTLEINSPTKSIPSPKIECGAFDGEKAKCTATLWAKKFEVPAEVTACSNSKNPAYYYTAYGATEFALNTFTIESFDDKFSNSFISENTKGSVWTIYKDNKNNGTASYWITKRICPNCDLSSANSTEFKSFSFDFNLVKSAPDLVVDTITVSGTPSKREIKAVIKNIGNGKLVAVKGQLMDAAIDLQGSNAPYSWSLLETFTKSISGTELKAGETKELIFTFPSIEPAKYNLTDFKTLEFYIHVYSYGDSFESDPFNNDKHWEWSNE
ncbi:MAG: C25 family cysteine peptidase [Candidatus Diapherotrites archaeon]|nr:C25 family cysteine peptidase [Candidatus Diapherotrites archaeon]